MIEKQGEKGAMRRGRGSDGGCCCCCTQCAHGRVRNGVRNGSCPASRPRPRAPTHKNRLLFCHLFTNSAFPAYIAAFTPRKPPHPPLLFVQPCPKQPCAADPHPARDLGRSGVVGGPRHRHLPEGLRAAGAGAPRARQRRGGLSGGRRRPGNPPHRRHYHRHYHLASEPLPSPRARSAGHAGGRGLVVA